MKEDCLVKIITRQEIEGERENLKSVTRGDFQGNEDEFTLTYTEKEEDGTVCTTTLAVSKSSVTVRREGSIITSMVIEKEKRNISSHETPYGTFSMGVTGKHISSEVTSGGGKLNFSYCTDTDFHPLGKIEFDIAFNFKSKIRRTTDVTDSK